MTIKRACLMAPNQNTYDEHITYVDGKPEQQNR